MALYIEISEYPMSTQISIDDLPYGILIYRYKNHSYQCIDANKIIAFNLNLSKKEILEKNLSDMFKNIKKTGLLEALKNVRETKEALNLDLKLSSKIITKSCICKSIQKLENDNLMLFFNDIQDEPYSQLMQDLKNTQETAHIGIWKWYMKTNIIQCSDEVYKIFGEEAQSFSVTIDKFFSYLNEKDKIIIEGLIKSSIKTKEPYLVEHEIIKKDSTRAYVQASGSVHYNENEKPIYINGTIFDISKNKENLLKLQESEEKFRKITEVSLMGIFLYKEKYIYINDAFSEMTGYSKSELLQQSPLDIIDKSMHTKLKENIKRRLQGEEFPHNYSDIVAYRKNGSKRIMRVLTQTTFYQGSYAGLGTVMDITDIIRNKAKLKLLAQAIEQTDEMVRITNKDGINTFVNEALLLHTGYRENELIGKNNNIFKSGKHTPEFYKKLWDTILAGKSYICTFINRKKNGNLYHEEMTITPILDKNSNIESFVATSKDITTRIELENELKRLAITDNLTGLYNRHYTHKELDINISNYKRYNDKFALFMIDIDFFKNINDEFGHDVGDYVLKELAWLIQKQIREGDHFGRWGGEEFMLIVPKISKQEAINIAQKIRLLISNYNFKNITNLTISIGITEFKTDDTKKTLLKRVDNALYKAKDNNRNCVVFE